MLRLENNKVYFHTMSIPLYEINQYFQYYFYNNGIDIEMIEIEDTNYRISYEELVLYGKIYSKNEADRLEELLTKDFDEELASIVVTEYDEEKNIISFYYQAILIMFNKILNEELTKEIDMVDIIPDYDECDLVRIDFTFKGE